MERQLILGDSREVVGRFPDDTFSAILTDPPYELTRLRGPGSGGMAGLAWDATGIAFDVTFWREVLRVTRPGAYMVAFGGSRTWHRLVCAIEDAGWTIAGSIQWVFAQGFAKSKDSLKPAHEPICLARKPISEATVSKNAQRWGTGVLNIEACKVATPGVADQPRRFPTTIVFSHTVFCTLVGHASIRSEGHYPKQGGRGGIGNSGHRGYTAEADTYTDGEVVERWDCDSACPVRELNEAGSKQHAARYYPTFHPDEQYLFRYCPKASTDERSLGLARPDDLPLFGGDTPPITINDFVAVKPLDLMTWLTRLVCPVGGRVLDPFLGSGTTLCAAALENLDAVGIELHAPHFEIACRRVAYWDAVARKTSVN